LEEQSNAVSKDKMTINEPNKDEVLKRTELEEEIQKNTNSVETSEKKIVSQNQNRQLESISTNLNSPDEDNRKPEGLAENKSDEPISLTEKTLDDNSTVAAGAMSTNSKLEAEADMIVYAETESVSKNTKKSKAAKEESKTYSNTGTMPAAEGQSDKVENQNIKTNIIPFSETMYDGGMNKLVSDLKKQIAKESIESVPETIILKGKINNKSTFIINSFECLPSSKNYNSKSLTNIIGKLSLPKPSPEMVGRQLLIINTSDNTWKISALSNFKIGGQYEKSLNKEGHYIKLLIDIEKYYII
jgi:hypothetical protein